MEKNSDYKHNLELASRDLDDFFIGCQVYGISSEDVISTIVDSLSSYLLESCHLDKSFKSEKAHFDLVPGDEVTICSEDNFFKVRFSSSGFSSWNVSCGLNTVVLSFNPIQDPIIINNLKGGVKHG